MIVLGHATVVSGLHNLQGCFVSTCTMASVPQASRKCNLSQHPYSASVFEFIQTFLSNCLNFQKKRAHAKALGSSRKQSGLFECFSFCSPSGPRLLDTTAVSDQEAINPEKFQAGIQCSSHEPVVHTTCAQEMIMFRSPYIIEAQIDGSESYLLVVADSPLQSHLHGPRA